MKNEKIILGTAQFGNKYGIANTKILKKDNYYKILDYALKKNIKILDTARSYGNEKIIGEYIKANKVENDIKIITKIPSFKNISKSKINFFLEKSLLNLNIKKFETLFFHDPSDIKFLLKNIKFFNKLKKDFGIKNLGFSIYEKKEFDLIKKIKTINSIQAPVNFVNQDFAELKNKKINLHARSIFLQGLLINKKINYLNLSKKMRVAHRKYFSFLKKHKINGLKFCMQYINSVKKCDYYIFGVNSVKQLSDIIDYKNSKNINLKHLKEARNFFNPKIADPRLWS